MDEIGATFEITPGSTYDYVIYIESELDVQFIVSIESDQVSGIGFQKSSNTNEMVFYFPNISKVDKNATSNTLFSILFKYGVTKDDLFSYFQTLYEKNKPNPNA